MKTLTLIFAMTFAAACGTAQASTHEREVTPQQATQSPSQGVGVLKEIDAKAGRVKIAHEPIAALHWPAMTMWFTLQGPLPQGLKAGDRVHFAIQQIQQTEWVITRIERKR